MFFGKPPQERPERGIPRSAKRQLFVLVLLLALVFLLSYRLVEQLQQGDSPPGGGAARPDLPLPGVGTPLDIWKPMEPQEPEPFEENAELLFRAHAKDRTGEIDEESTTYLFQKILADPEAFRAEEPALSLDADDEVFRQLDKHPDLYRGRLVEVKGIVVSPGEGLSPLQLRGLEFPNPSGRDRCFQSWIYGTDDKYYTVATLNKRPDITHRQGARVRGYFCQLYTGDVIHRGKLAKGTIPFLVGEDYEIINNPVSEEGDMTIFLVIAIPLILVVFPIVYIVNRRAQKSYQRRRRQARRQVHEAKDAKDEESGGGDVENPQRGED